VTAADCIAPKTGLTGYKIHRCRCNGCTAANRDYRSRYDRLNAYGRWQPFVDAGPARQHIQALRDARMGVARIAELAGVGYATVNRLIWGIGGRQPTKRIRPHIEAAILKVRADVDTLVDDRAIDATGTHRRAQALAVVGWSMAAQAERLGWESRNYNAVLRQGQVYVRTARAVRALYDELWDKQPDPSWTVERTRGWAASKGWVGPGAWDDDTIDDPHAEPNLGGADDADLVDEIAVHRVLNGEEITLNAAEREHAIAVGLTRGMSPTAISLALRMSGARVRELAAQLQAA
jgi:hypothetical protein